LETGKKRKLRKVKPSERGWEIVELIKKDGEDFVLIKLRLKDLSKLTILKTEEERRIYQREAQKRYRERLAAAQKRD